jgi:transketolase
MSRQKLPILAGTPEKARAGVAKGGYILRDASGEAGAPDLILVATGSELQLAVGAADLLEGQGIRTRVVSLPCWERFEAQEATYRDAVLPPAIHHRVAIEALTPFGWERYATSDGAIIGIEHFGASAPGDEVLRRFGFTVERVAEIGRAVVRDGLSGRVATVERGPETC